MGTWIVSAVVALLFINLPGQFVGPLGNLANGADISLPVGLALAVVLYLASLVVFPEPRAVYGPAGPRFVGRPTPKWRRSPAAPRRRRPSPPRPSEPREPPSASRGTAAPGRHPRNLGVRS